MTASKSLKTLCVIASCFIQGRYWKILIFNAQPADRDTVCFPFWTHPAWILLLSLRTTDELSAVARPWTCPSSLKFSSHSESSFEAVCACVCTFIRICYACLQILSQIQSSRLCKSKVFCSFLYMSLFLHILFSYLCRLLSSASTLTSAIYLQLSSLEIRGKT